MEKRPAYDLSSIVDNVRSRMVKWQRKQKSAKLRELKEYAQYKVSVKLNRASSSEYPTVTVWCGLCRNNYMLAHKQEKSGDVIVMISNWTTHVKKCVEKAGNEKMIMKQSSILHFIPDSDPGTKVASPLQCVAIDINAKDDVASETADKVSLTAMSEFNDGSMPLLNVDSESEASLHAHNVDGEGSSTSGTDFVQASPVLVTQEGHLY